MALLNGNPLCLELVLNSIFHHLSVQDLLRCRRVNRLWNSTIVRYLRDKGHLVKVNKKNISVLVKILSEQTDPLPGLLYHLEICSCDLGDLKVRRTLYKLFELIGFNCVQNLKCTWHGDLGEIPQDLFDKLLDLLRVISSGLKKIVILPQMPRSKETEAVSSAGHQMDQFSFPLLSIIQFGTYFDTNYFGTDSGCVDGDWNSCSQILSLLLNSAPHLKSLDLQDLAMLHLPPNSYSRRLPARARQIDGILVEKDLTRLGQLNDCKYLATIEDFQVDLSNFRVREVISGAFQFEALKKLTIIVYEVQYLNINNFILHNRHTLTFIKFMFGKFNPAETEIFFQGLPLLPKLKHFEYSVLVPLVLANESLGLVTFETPFVKENCPKLESICYQLDIDLVSPSTLSSRLPAGFRVEFHGEARRNWTKLATTVRRLKEKMHGEYYEPSSAVFLNVGKLNQVVIENRCSSGATTASTNDAIFLNSFAKALFEGVTGIQCLELNNCSPTFLRELDESPLPNPVAALNLKCLRHLKQISTCEAESGISKTGSICQRCTPRDLLDEEVEGPCHTVSESSFSNRSRLAAVIAVLPKLELFETE